MRDPVEGEDQTVRGTPWFEKALHDLCQPLTALECGLYLSSLNLQKDPTLQVAELRETIRHALVQCDRMIKSVRVMQDGVRLS